jgi:hypothetical protein
MFNGSLWSLGIQVRASGPSTRAAWPTRLRLHCDLHLTRKPTHACATRAPRGETRMLRQLRRPFDTLLCSFPVRSNETALERPAARPLGGRVAFPGRRRLMPATPPMRDLAGVGVTGLSLANLIPNCYHDHSRRPPIDPAERKETPGVPDYSRRTPRAARDSGSCGVTPAGVEIPPLALRRVHPQH